MTNLELAVVDAFQNAPLPARAFRLESDMEAALLPEMHRLLAPSGITLVTHGVRRVPCFLPGETREPDGEARQGNEAIALELKLLRGDRHRDGGEFHRGFGQCFTYVASRIYSSALMLVLHQGNQRSLQLPPDAIGLDSKPFRQVHIIDRWHPGAGTNAP